MAIQSRRHHTERLKNNRKHHWGRDISQEPKALSQAARTPCTCSCTGCGNDRRLEGETMQERRADSARDGCLEEERTTEDYFYFKNYPELY